MNTQENRELLNFSFAGDLKAPPELVNSMFCYSDEAMATLKYAMPSVISAMRSFPHRPKDVLHSELTSTRDYMPPLPG